MVWLFPSEYLRLVALGISKHKWNKLTDAKYENHLLKFQRNEVDRRLLSIRPPSELYRVPDIISKKSSWKGSDWLYWLLFYEIPCLEGVINKDILEYFLRLNNCMFALLGDKIEVNEFENIQDDIIKFCKDFEKIFGMDFCTSNVHALLHLCASVRKCGPLWATSAFAPESKIGKIKESVKGTNKVADQIADRNAEYYEQRNRLLSRVTKIDTIAAMFCNNLLSKTEKPTFNYQESDEKALVYTDYVKESGKYTRCSFNNTIYHSIDYKRAKTTDNTIIMLQDGRIGQIKYFYLEENKANLCINEFSVHPFQIDDIVWKNIFYVLDIKENVKISISKVKKN